MTFFALERKKEKLHFARNLFALERDKFSLINMSMGSITQLYNKLKPFLAVFLLQLGYAGMAIVGKFALNKGMSQHVFVVYRHAVATVVIAPFALVVDRSPFPLFLLFTFVSTLFFNITC